MLAVIAAVVRPDGPGVGLGGGDTALHLLVARQHRAMIAERRIQRMGRMGLGGLLALLQNVGILRPRRRVPGLGHRLRQRGVPRQHQRGPLAVLDVRGRVALDQADGAENGG